MNRIDDQLNRLFRAAKPVQSGQVDVPFGLETRALAAWRESGSPDIGFWDTRLLVRGLILASFIMVICLWPVVNKASDPFSDYLQLADSTTLVDNSR